MIYDLTSFECAAKSLKEFIKIVDIRKIFHYVSSNKDNYNYVDFCEYLNIDFDGLDISNIYLKVIHISTNNNQCNDVKKIGLLNLQDTINSENELSIYIKSKGINIDIENETIQYRNHLYNKLDYLDKSTDYSINFEEVKDTFRKLYKDYQINGFICNEKPVEYGGNIRYRPEILNNLSLMTHNNSIEQDWVSKCNNMCYSIEFKAHVYDFIWFNYQGDFKSNEEYMDNRNFYIKKWLINSALSVISSSLFYDSLPEIYAYLNFNHKVLPNDILTITEIKNN